MTDQDKSLRISENKCDVNLRKRKQPTLCSKEPKRQRELPSSCQSITINDDGKLAVIYGNGHKLNTNAKFATGDKNRIPNEKSIHCSDLMSNEKDKVTSGLDTIREMSIEKEELSLIHDKTQPISSNSKVVNLNTGSQGDMSRKDEYTSRTINSTVMSRSEDILKSADDSHNETNGIEKCNSTSSRCQWVSTDRDETTSNILNCIPLVDRGKMMFRREKDCSEIFDQKKKEKRSQEQADNVSKNKVKKSINDSNLNKNTSKDDKIMRNKSCQRIVQSRDVDKNKKENKISPKVSNMEKVKLDNENEESTMRKASKRRLNSNDGISKRSRISHADEKIKDDTNKKATKNCDKILPKDKTSNVKGHLQNDTKGKAIKISCNKEIKNDEIKVENECHRSKTVKKSVDNKRAHINAACKKKDETRFSTSGIISIKRNSTPTNIHDDTKRGEDHQAPKRKKEVSGPNLSTANRALNRANNGSRSTSPHAITSKDKNQNNSSRSKDSKSPTVKPTQQIDTLLQKIDEQNDTIRNLQNQLSAQPGSAATGSSEPNLSESSNVGLQLGSVSATEDLPNFPWVEIPNNITMSKQEPRSLDIPYRRYSSVPSYASSFNVHQREMHLVEENDALKGEVQELRDHADLLEFRIFEFTEGIQRASGVPLPTCHQSTSTDDATTGGVSGLISNHQTGSEDLPSLPLSLDSGLEDFFDASPKSRISEYRRSLSKLSLAAPSECHSIHHLNSLIDWVAQNGGTGTPSTPLSPKSLKMEAPLHTLDPLKGESQDHNLERLDVEMVALALKLQESLDEPANQETVLMESIAKLHSLSSSLSSLQSRVATLTAENTNLTDAMSALSESHETRTEASATESDQVHRKSPSYSSDLSDIESEESPRPRRQKRIQDLSTSFQESGIFEEDSEAGVNTSTQTEIELSPNEDKQQCICGRFTNVDDDVSRDVIQSQLPHEKSLEQSEIDLQTAVARLTSIKDVVQENDIRNFRLQDLQESDEYLVSPADEGHIALTKREYDTILSTERSLTRELEMMQCEREQATAQLTSLEDKLKRATKNDISEVLRGEIRVLEQRLDASEHYRRQFFDEKCEFEEAENDARLLSQRLESQLEAAREMESLLSASLSQEQEFSRELQRRVRELQMIDKGRRIHEEVLEAEARACREREETLIVANENYLLKITFTLYSLILAQIWRSYAAQNPKALVTYTPPIPAQYSSLTNMAQWINNAISQYTNSSPYTQGIEKSEFSELMDYTNMEDQEPSLMDSQISNRHTDCANFNCDSFQPELNPELNGNVCYVNVCDMYTQTEDYEGCRSVSVQVEMLDDAFSAVPSVEDWRRKNGFKDSDTELSEREQFYLEQIESLQNEKRGLRKDYESETTESFHQVQEMRKKLNSLEDALKEVEEDRCRLMFKLEETQAEALEAERNLQRKRKEMKEDLRTSIDVLNREQDVLQRQYEERLSELRLRNGSYEDRIALLMHQLSALRQELTPFLVLQESEGYKSEDAGEAGDGDSVGDLAKSVRVLIRTHNSFKKKVEELENKDNAYRETINEADRLMSSHMTMYTRRIEELEASQDQKDLRISQLESSEERLRDALRKSSKNTDEGDKISELLDKLLATENSALGLKEQLWLLERNEKELRIKLVESEKVQQSLRRELRDQEDLVQRLMSLTTENNALTSQLQEAHECSRRASEMQQNENYLKGRVEELESTEGALRDALMEAQQIIKHRDKKYREQCQNLQEDIAQLKAQLETSIAEGERAKEIESSLRDQLATYREKSLSFDKEMSDTQLNENQYRAEVAKLRSQLKLGNMQLTDLDGLNGELRDKLTMAEEAMKQVVSQLEERSRRHESEVLSLNLELSQKDSKLEDIESQLQSVSQTNAAAELDCLTNLPLNSLKEALDNVFETAKECSSCQFSDNNLNTLQESLKSLNEVINGRISQSDSDTEESESSPSKLCSVASEAGDSQKESNTLDHSQRSQTPNLEESLKVCVKVPTPSVPPRPRRDAKKRRKTRVRNTEGSLMDELEEGVFGTSPASFNVLEEFEDRIKDLEEEVARKEEELKLADAESAELHSRLMRENGERGRKASEVTDLTLSLSSLRDQLVQTVQEYEHSKNIVESQHKALVESLNLKVEALQSALSALGEKTCVKDAIIQTLIGQIKDILRSGNLGVLVTQIRLLGNNGNIIMRGKYPDFDIQSVCELMSQPREVPQDITDDQSAEPELNTSRSQSLPSLSNSASSKRTPLKRDSKSFDKKDETLQRLEETQQNLDETPQKHSESALTSTHKTLPPLSNQRKSRIPLMRPSSVPPIKIDEKKSKMRNSKERQAPSALSPMKEHQNARDQFSTPTGRKNYRQNSARVEPKGLKPLERLTPNKNRPTAKVTPTTYAQRRAPSTASSGRRISARPNSPMKKQIPACAPSNPSTPSVPRFSPWANKDPETSRSSSKYITDARKIKRMVMGVTPLDASVDCPAAPEWAQSTPNLASHAQAPTCIPRPTDLRITRRVGVDGVVIAWSSVDHDCIQGFQVLVGGHMVQVVRSPHRTKALVTGLPFPSPFTIALVAVSNDGRVSLPTLVSHERNNVYKSRLDSATSLASSNRSKAVHLPVHTALRAAAHINVSPRRAVPTCL